MEMVPSSAQVAELNKTWGDRVLAAEEGERLGMEAVEAVSRALGKAICPCNTTASQLAEAAGIPLRRLSWDAEQPVIEGDLIPLEENELHTSGYIRHGEIHGAYDGILQQVQMKPQTLDESVLGIGYEMGPDGPRLREVSLSGEPKTGQTHYFKGDPFDQPPGETVMYIDGGEVG